LKDAIKKMNWAYDLLDQVNRVIVLVLMGAMCIDLICQVISRYCFHYPLTWSEELARYMFVWISLVGSAWAGRRHIHVRMTALISKFSDRGQHIQQVLISLICCVCCIALIQPAIAICANQSKLVAVTLGCSLGIEYLAAPIGIIWMALQQGVDALYAAFDWEGYKTRYPQQN
jgi:TRAP-type C4-dicarboxylate transport system permease small subunit